MAAYTATVNLNATPADGYVFAGWYDNSDNCLSGEKNYSYQTENSGKTIIAKFVKSSKKTIYLKPSLTWLTDNARFTAYFYNESIGHIWINMTDGDKDGIYECEIPEGYKQVIFTFPHTNSSPSKALNISTLESNW